MRYPIEADTQTIILPVSLEGRLITDGRFVLDTGASFVTIPWKIARALDLQPEMSQERVTITKASGTEIVPIVTIPAITVLGNRAENMPAIVHDLPPQSRVDGLLGLSFLRHFKLTIDFHEGYVEITLTTRVASSIGRAGAS